jgi:hypothetical protein
MSTHFWRFCSNLDMPARVSSETRLCHSNLPVGPLHIACWNVCKTHAACKFLNDCTASMRKSASGLPSAVSFAIASSTCSYRCKCSDGRFRKTLSSILRASGWRLASYGPLRNLLRGGDTVQRTSRNSRNSWFLSVSSFNRFSASGKWPT